MSKLYYKTHQLARSIESKGEVNNLPSQTIPGEAESIAEMFRKFQNGIPIRSRPKSDSDYVTLDHDSPNFELLHPSIDRLTSTVIIPDDPIEKAKIAAALKAEQDAAKKAAAEAKKAEEAAAEASKKKEGGQNA